MANRIPFSLKRRHYARDFHPACAWWTANPSGSGRSPSIFDYLGGRFTIDDNSHLWDPALPQFILEYRDETAWDLIPLEVCRTMKDKGWNRVTPLELVGILRSAGAIRVQHE